MFLSFVPTLLVKIEPKTEKNEYRVSYLDVIFVFIHQSIYY